MSQSGPPFSEADIAIASTHMGRQVFMDQLADDMIGIRAVATADQMKAVHAGVRLVFDCIDNYGYQIVGEEGDSLNPPHESVDFGMAKLWDNYVERVNS
uniref:Uncharacterized protein n=1 Tax=Pseudomonas phage RVTF4 TaxID=3236931 RepID=A0AB39CCC4_9VIRU